MPWSERTFLKNAFRSPNAIKFSLLICGIFALACSVIFTSSILAFIGLSLTFWGVLLLYLTQEKYVKFRLLDSTVIPSLEALAKIIKELDCKGKAVYLPPKYLKDFKSGMLYIPKKQEVRIPTVGEVSEEKTFSKNPNGLCIAPSGLTLTNLFERELGTDFVRVDLQYLQNNLPKILVENLEIAQDLEINLEGSLVQLKLTESIYKDLCKKTRTFPNICNSLGCPLSSSIACALSRTTGKPIIIEKTECSEDGKTINVQYRILEE